MSIIGHDLFVICSFCNRESRQLRYVVVGPNNANICNECIDTCKELIEQKLKEEEEKLKDLARNFKTKHVEL